MLKEVTEFHEIFGHPVNVVPTFELLELRHNLISEEAKETAEELAILATQIKYDADADAIVKTKARLTKELADILYVVYGTAVALGLPLEEGFKEVHRSNLSKLDADGKPILREDGKVLKGPNYTEANMDQFFNV